MLGMDSDTRTEVPPIRLRVDLPGPIADALRDAAIRDRRSMPEQAAWLLIQTLRRHKARSERSR